MRVLLDIEDKYANVLSITLVGVRMSEINVTTHGVDLTKFNCVEIKKDKATNKYLEEIAD